MPPPPDNLRRLAVEACLRTQEHLRRLAVGSRHRLVAAGHKAVHKPAAVAVGSHHRPVLRHSSLLVVVRRDPVVRMRRLLANERLCEEKNNGQWKEAVLGD